MMEPSDSNEKTAAHVPNAGRAAVSNDKLVMYLMNPAHALGGPKCRFLMGFGISTW